LVVSRADASSTNNRHPASAQFLSVMSWLISSTSPGFAGSTRRKTQTKARKPTIYPPSRMIEITELLVKQHPVGSLFRDEREVPGTRPVSKKP